MLSSSMELIEPLPFLDLRSSRGSWLMSDSYLKSRSIAGERSLASESGQSGTTTEVSPYTCCSPYPRSFLSLSLMPILRTASGDQYESDECDEPRSELFAMPFDEMRLLLLLFLGFFLPPKLMNESIDESKQAPPARLCVRWNETVCGRRDRSVR